MSVKKPTNLVAKRILHISNDGVFFSIQGEGVSMGKTACFLRLQGCNLRCRWCDTKYTWGFKNGELWSIKKTEKEIQKNWKCKNSSINKRLVITGGEPLLQKDQIEILLKQLSGWEIEIETNGTIMPTPRLLKRCQFNCSPKLKNSGSSKKARIKKEVINALCRTNTNFKFVITRIEDIKEIEEDFLIPFNIDPNKVIIMPQGITAREIQKNAKKVIEIVKQKGYRLLGRTHIIIWGAKRGV